MSPHPRPNRCVSAAVSRTVAAIAIAAVGVFVTVPRAYAQPPPPPEIKAGALTGSIHADGVLDEAAWAAAPAIENLTMSEPTPGSAPTSRTRVRVLVSRKEIVFGIECDDPDPRGIVSHTKARDASLASEDHVKVVLDTSRDGRFGYIFAVNPGGARYDALVNPNGGSENADWDGIWEAGTRRDDKGWSVEIRIPVATLSFKKGLDSWHFNVERRIQRLQETDRWANASLDYKVTQTNLAGLLKELPDFDLGHGLSVRPAVTVGAGVPAPDLSVDGSFEPSLDVTQRLGSNLLGSLTVNTDFAETEVDTRRTNFTRFPLFFPEKRTFFLEGSDVFVFGLSLRAPVGTVLPYYSRRVGLVQGQEVPIDVGGKVSGRAGNTNIGAQLVHMGKVDKLAPSTTLGVLRLKQNVLEQSSVGMIATVGDPLGRTGSWLTGGDVTYKTSRFAGNKNLYVGLWGMAMGRDDLKGNDSHAEGVSIEFPNDKFAFWGRFRRIGTDFDPSLGFVEQAGVYVYDSKWFYKPRPDFWNIRQMNYELHWRQITDLGGEDLVAELFGTFFYWVFESGDTIEVNGSINKQRLIKPFEVSPGVVIPPGTYHFNRSKASMTFAPKRRLSGSAAWWFGNYYGGTLDQIILTANWNPSPLVTVELSGEHDIGRLPVGDFTQDLVGTRLRLNISPNMQLSSYVQYDTISRSLGTNTRFRWTFRPLGDLFVIYNHNVRELENPAASQSRWQLDSNQLLVKLQYAFRY